MVFHDIFCTFLFSLTFFYLHWIFYVFPDERWCLVAHFFPFVESSFYSFFVLVRKVYFPVKDSMVLYMYILIRTEVIIISVDNNPFTFNLLRYTYYNQFYLFRLLWFLTTPISRCSSEDVSATIIFENVQLIVSRLYKYWPSQNIKLKET